MTARVLFWLIASGLSLSLLLDSVLVDVEAYSLGQWKLGAVVDGVGGAAHVLLPGIGAGFAATAGLFFAAEGSADFGARGAYVDVGDAAVGAGGGEELFSFAQVHGEDAGGEALGYVVVEGKGFGELTIFEDVEDGGEGFAFDDFGLGGGFDEGGADVEGIRIFGGDAIAAGDGGSASASFFESTLHGEVGALVDERADQGAGFARVAYDDGGIDLLESRDELVVDGFVDDEAA